MSGIDLTTAMARLLTQPSLRATFREAPERAAHELGVRPEDREALLRLEIDQLEQQAEGLLHKRYHEVRELLPGSLRGVNNAAALFEAYAQTCWPEGHTRHLQDAVGFADYLQKTAQRRVNRFERHWLAFRLGTRRWGWKIVPDYPWQGSERFALIWMWRPRGGAPRCRAWLFPLGSGKRRPGPAADPSVRRPPTS